MTHDDAKRLLAPLARGADRSPVDVSAWVMRDVRALAATRPRDDDAIVWRLAAACGATAAVVVVGVASIAFVADDGAHPLAELAGVAGLEAR